MRGRDVGRAPAAPYHGSVIITVIEHTPSCPLDRFGPWIERAPGPAPDVRVLRPWAGDVVPSSSAEVGDGLIVLDGQGHAYDDAGSPWLPATRDLLADAVRTGLPTLGLCLGAQLLAVATGGRVQVGAPPGRESGVIDVHPRPQASGDALLGALAAAVPADHPLAGGVMLAMPSMHADAVVDLPPGAAWLASSRLYPYQAFRVGTAAWGLQFNPEVSEQTFAAWADLHDDVDTEAVRAEFLARQDLVEAGGAALAHRFAELAQRWSAGEPLQAEPALAS